ncbi:MAG: lysophospholipase [Lachnospiraceae bacterium]|nr:lysophospholipase [Lachnospiraceae bacterium]
MVRYFDINNPGYSIKCKIFTESMRDINKVIVFMHGFGGHKDNKACEHFAEAALSKMKKAAVVIFDWPCHGTDVRKKLTLEDCDIYLTMVLDYIKDTWTDEIYAYGTSFGGYLALKYIHDHESNPFKRIALRCPAISIGEVMYSRILSRESAEALEKGKDVEAGFDRKVLINKAFLDELMDKDIRKWSYLDFADDILIIHGNKDEIVSIDESRNFCDNNVIELIEVEDADHRFQDLNKMKLAHSHMIDFYTGKI